MDLRLFGAIHVDRPGKVARELAAVADGTDALLLERPASTAPLREWARFFVRAPLAAVGFGVVALSQFPLVVLLTRSLEPPEQVAAREYAATRDLPVHGVDDPVAAMADWGGPLWVAANWLCLLVVLLTAPVAGPVTAAAFALPRAVYQPAYRHSRALGTALAAVTVVGAPAAVLALDAFSLGVFVFAAGFTLLLFRRTIPARDATMAENALAVGDAHGYDDATLVVGRSHLPGVRRALAGRDAAVTRVHASRFLRDGTTDDDPDPPAATTRASPDPEDSDVLGERAVAALLDLFGAGLAVVAGFAGGVALTLDVLPGDAGTWVAVAAALFAGFAYYAATEAIWSTTPGKRLLGLVTVTTDGDRIRGREAVLRNLLRPVDAVGFYLVGVLVAAVADDQRLGDLLAGTVVVERPD